VIRGGARARSSFILIAAVATLISMVPASPARAGGCGAAWEIVPSPDGGPGQSQLTAVSTVDTGEIWAVGFVQGATTSTTLIEHWDGSHWEVVPSPNPTSEINRLEDVVAAAEDDVWAVGSVGTDAGGSRNLILHWDGSAWVVSLLGPRLSYLQGVTAAGPSDAWAVGAAFDSGRGAWRPMTLHWDGGAWTPFWTGTRNGDTYLTSVAGAGAQLVAVGTGQEHLNLPRTPISAVWDGTRWAVVAPPRAGKDDWPTDVSALSEQDAWLVGRYYNPAHGTYLSLIDHWNGSAWSRVPSPNSDSINWSLEGVIAVSTGDAWAVGDTSTEFGGGAALILHWNGADWSIVPSANGAGPTTVLMAIDQAADGSLWSVGYSGDSTVVEHYCPA
jgi:hypothetical protein